MATERRVLSIQSHVAFGYVGGKAAVFPLQCLGFDVDVVNTVNFSNHSGYGRFGGSKATAQELSGIFDVLQANGYIPGAEALATVAALVIKLRTKDTECKLIYLLDPVMGDAGKLYVSPEVVPIYRSLLPQATIITPNWFEIEVLTKIELSDRHSLNLALKVLHHEHRVPHVIMSSMPLGRSFRDALPRSIRPDPCEHGVEEPEGFLICVSSSCANVAGEESAIVHAHCLPHILGYFSGVGDLFSALVLAHYDPETVEARSGPAEESDTETPLSRAASHALSKTHAILQLTHAHAQHLSPADRTPTDDEKDRTDPERLVRRMRGRELRLVQGQDILRGAQPVAYRRMTLWEDFWDA